jgi:hypothetical protein
MSLVNNHVRTCLCLGANSAVMYNSGGWVQQSALVLQESPSGSPLKNISSSNAVGL